MSVTSAAGLSGRRKAKHYDITCRLCPAPGYPQRAQRLRAVQALGLRRVTAWSTSHAVPA